jgi:hypothetical protein
MKADFKHLEGKRIQLVKCTDEYTSLPQGTKGTVSLVDDVGTVHVKWDNGSYLGLCYDAGDRWFIVE